MTNPTLPDEALCIEHGGWHLVETADPSCVFQDGFGDEYDWQGDKLKEVE